MTYTTKSKYQSIEIIAFLFFDKVSVRVILSLYIFVFVYGYTLSTFNFSKTIYKPPEKINK